MRCLILSLFLLINSTFAYSGGHITEEDKKEAIKYLIKKAEEINLNAV